ncbi:putative preQ0 transporter [Vibrio phage PS25B.1]|nr:putative preQ0 transporter [Vibrio phage PS25B.1]
MRNTQKCSFKGLLFGMMYVSSVVGINIAFATPGLILTTPFTGLVVTLGSVIAGVVFVTRDYAQRELGHIRVLPLMVIAGGLSWLTADPYVATASIAAFAVAEVVDYVTYTFNRCDFKKRVVISSLASVPVDTVVFLMMINNITLTEFIIMCLSKWIVILVVIHR